MSCDRDEQSLVEERRALRPWSDADMPDPNAMSISQIRRIELAAGHDTSSVPDDDLVAHLLGEEARAVERWWQRTFSAANAPGWRRPDLNQREVQDLAELRRIARMDGVPKEALSALRDLWTRGAIRLANASAYGSPLRSFITSEWRQLAERD
jgi:hypothetical protein